MSFYSFTPFRYKANSIKTLINRGFRLCSNWTNFDTEMKKLHKYFVQNGYRSDLFYKILNGIVDKIFKPPSPIFTAPKKKIYITMPFLGNKQDSFSKELRYILCKFYPFLEIYIAPINPLKIGTFFKFKDSLPAEFRFGVVYKYSCPKCTLGTYIGCTIRQLIRG